MEFVPKPSRIPTFSSRKISVQALGFSLNHIKESHTILPYTNYIFSFHHSSIIHLLSHGIFINGRMGDKKIFFEDQVLGTDQVLPTCFVGCAFQTITQQNQMTMSWTIMLLLSSKASRSSCQISHVVFM